MAFVKIVEARGSEKFLCNYVCLRVDDSQVVVLEFALRMCQSLFRQRIFFYFLERNSKEMICRGERRKKVNLEDKGQGKKVYF